MNTPHDPAVMAAWIALHRTSRALLDRVEADLKAAGLPPLSWYDVLLEVDRARDRPLRQGELGARMLLAKHGISRLVDRLERDGLIARQPCPEDQRGHLIVITAAGRALKQRMWTVYGASLSRHFGDRLPAGDAARLASLLPPLVDEE